MMIVVILAAVMTIAGRDTDGRRSFRAFEERAVGGDPEAQFRLALVLETGWDSVPPDSLRALGFIRKSAMAGYPPAMNYLGYLYRNGYRVAGRELITVNNDSSRQWLRRSADKGDARAMANLAFLILETDSATCGRCHREEQDSIAYRYLSAAAGQKVPTALSMLGDLSRYGRIVKKDTLKAMAYYEAALQQGLGDAEVRLISLMRSRWLSLPADSALNLGIRYYSSYAPAAGVILFEQAVDYAANRESGNICDTLGNTTVRDVAAKGMVLLGDAYSRGIGVKYDHLKSLGYFAGAALLGNPSAMFILAETLEIFPDALSDLRKNSSSIPGLHPDSDPDSETKLLEISDPQWLRRHAAEAGIVSAHDADKAIFKPL